MSFRRGKPVPFSKLSISDKEFIVKELNASRCLPKFNPVKYDVFPRKQLLPIVKRVTGVKDIDRFSRSQLCDLLFEYRDINRDLINADKQLGKLNQQLRHKEQELKQLNGKELPRQLSISDETIKEEKQEIEEELNECRRELKIIRTQKKNIEKELNKVQKGITRNQKSTRDKIKQLQADKQRQKTLDSQISKFRQLEKTLRSELAKERQTNINFGKENKELKRQLKEIASLKKQISQLETNKQTDFNLQLDDLESLIIVRDQQLQQLDKLLEEKETIEELEARIEELELQLQGADEDEAQLRQNIAFLEGEVRKSEDAVRLKKQVDLSNANLKKELARLQGKLQQGFRGDKVFKDLQEQIGKLKKENKTLKAKNQKLGVLEKQGTQSLRNDISKIRKLIRQFEKEKDILDRGIKHKDALIHKLFSQTVTLTSERDRLHARLQGAKGDEADQTSDIANNRTRTKTKRKRRNYKTIER